MRLSRFELQVMEVLWRTGEVSVREVHEALPKDPAYTTVPHLPRLAARTRYAIVFLALVKFAIPWKLHPPSGTIAISIPGPIAVTPHAFAAPSIWPTVAMSIWISIAAALFLLIVWRAR